MLVPHTRTDVPASRNSQSLALGSLYHFGSGLLPHIVVVTMALREAFAATHAGKLLLETQSRASWSEVHHGRLDTVWQLVHAAPCRSRSSVLLEHGLPLEIWVETSDENMSWGEVDHDPK